MITKKIEHILLERGLNKKDLASKLDCTPSNLNAKMKRDNWTEGDLRHICELLDCEYEIIIRTKDTMKQF